MQISWVGWSTRTDQERAEAGRRAGEAVAVFPHNVDHIRSRAAQHMIVMLCKTTGGTCGSWASTDLQPLANCWCDDDCEIKWKRTFQPRSPCELHPVDHPHRPGSHQQSRCCCSNLQSSPLPLTLVKHIIWKIWGATPKHNLSLSLNTRKIY